MLLAIDIGNTNILIGIIKDINTFPLVDRLTTDLKKTDTEYFLLIKQIIELHDSDLKIEKAVISSVVPEITDNIINEIKRLFKCKGFELFINEHKYEILDIDIYDFFEISVRTSLSDIKNRFSTINALIKKSIKSINKPEIEQLAEYKDLLINKYEEIRNGNSS